MISARRASILWILLLFSGLAAGCDPEEGTVSADAADAVDTGDETAGQDSQDGAPSEDSQLDAAPHGWLPQTTTDLYGGWENLDGGVLRRYEFRFLDNGFADLFNLTPVYRLYRSEGGQEPELLERGVYKLGSGPQLHTTPQWALDPVAVGKVRKVAFLPAQNQGSFELEVVPGVGRAFFKMASFDFP